MSSPPPYTLADLLAGENLNAIGLRLLSTFQGLGFPALTEWAPKAGIEMTYQNMAAGAMTDLVAANIPDIVSSGFLGKASTNWLRFFSDRYYGFDYVPATSTTFNMDLVVASTVNGAYTWNPGDIEIVASGSGNRYRNSTGGVGAPGGRVTLTFQAEGTGSTYSDDPKVVPFTMVTTFAGVTVQPTNLAFSPVYQTGPSTGQLLPTLTGLPPANQHSYLMRIDSTGDVGAARFSLSLDGGPFVPQGVLFASQPLPLGGITLLALNGSGTPSSFVAGDTFVFSAPGGSGYVQGANDESNAHLAGRCRGRWTTLSLDPTDGLMQLWAVTAVPSASRIQVYPDLPTDPTAVPGRVSLYVADSRGPIDASALAKITAYIVPRLSILDGFVARPAVGLPIALGGNVVVTPTTIVAVQQAAEIAWTNYLGNVAIGDVVEIADLEQVLMDAGAVDVGTFTSLSLNGGFTDIKLGPGQVPTKPATLVSQLTWTF